MLPGRLASKLTIQASSVQPDCACAKLSVLETWWWQLAVSAASLLPVDTLQHSVGLSWHATLLHNLEPGSKVLAAEGLAAASS